MAAYKQLIVVIEGTATTGAHWKTILSAYLEKIIKTFCGDELEKSHISTEGRPRFELALIMFNSLRSYGPLFMRSGWTRFKDNFMDWLSSMQFLGGDVDDVVTTDGLADALMMFAIPPNGYNTEENLEGKRHCILIASSNPFPLPRAVFRPNFDNYPHPSAYADTETVAGWFGQCSVSLSVICPRKLPKIKALYEAGKRNPNSEDPPIQVQHPNFLVLISEDFKEALAALNPTSLAPCQDSITPLRPEIGGSTYRGCDF